MIKTIALVLVTTFMGTAYSAQTIPAEKVSKHITTVVQPKPIKRFPPQYPKSAARDMREGWAKLSFVIEKDGSVSNVLVNETSGSTDFAKASMRAVSKWKYTPAFENGEPIQQCVNSVQLNFKMRKNSPKGVRRKFRSKYNVAKEHLNNKEYENLKLVLEDMSAIKKRHMSENNYLHLLWSDYESAMGNKNKELFHLHRVALELLPEKNQFSVLSSMFTLQVSQNLLRDAHGTYLALSKLSSAKPYMEQYNQYVNSIDQAISGDKDIVIAADIQDKEYWSHRLVRNEFSLVNVKGTLNKLDVRCANKRHVYTVEENNTWSLPKAWKNCNIYVYGDNHAQFNLVERPFSNKA